ncbi:MAG: hypothetical protein GY759_07910 [Chloroflexi bacterium]|nr:hypothetical protein [Chloroflexota bacterium]
MKLIRNLLNYTLILITALLALSTDARADTPVANDDFYVTPSGQNLKVAAPGILENDTGVGTIANILYTQPANGGMVVVETDGSFEYEPPEDILGSYSFTYTIDDGTNTSNNATVYIEVTQPIAGPAYTNETDFLNALLALGYAASTEGFEWDFIPFCSLNIYRLHAILGMVQ